MYDELVKALRNMSKMGVKYGMAAVKMQEAADTIEELSVLCASQSKDCSEAIAKYIDLWERQPHWIPVTERLPNPKDLVLVCNEFGGVHYGYFESNKRWYTANNWLADAWTVMPNVTHWMPLPEPPKEET